MLSYRAIARAGWGFLIWAAASVGCGLSTGFWSLLIWRIIMGAGEASIPKLKTLWFGILFLVGHLLEPLLVANAAEKKLCPHCKIFSSAWQMIHPADVTV